MDDPGLYTHNLLNQLCIALVVYRSRICGVWRSGKYTRVVGVTPYIVNFSSHLTNLETNLSSAVCYHSLDRCSGDTGSSGTIPQSYAYSFYVAIFDIGFCRSVADTPLQPCIESIRRGESHIGQCHSLTRDSAHLFARNIYAEDKELGLMVAVILLYSFGCSRHTFATTRRMRCCGPCCRRRWIVAM